MRVPQALPHVLPRRFPLRATAMAGAACAVLVLSACSTAPQSAPAQEVAATGAQTTSVTQLQKFLWVFSPYRPDIQQGNFVSQEMLGLLKEGMTRDQARFILGTPMVMDAFHEGRWDYPFRMARGNGELTTARVSIFFKDGKVARIDGGNLPTEREYIARIAGPIKGERKAAPEKEDAKNVIQLNK